MVQVDVTTPLTAGLNAGSHALGGFAHGLMARDQNQLRKDALKAQIDQHADDLGFRDRLADIRLKEMEQRAQETALDTDYRKRMLDLDERRVGLAEEETKFRAKDREATGAATVYAGALSASLDAKNAGDLEKMLSEQRRNAMSFAANSTPAGRALILGTLEDDEKQERLNFARTVNARKWNALGTNPALAQYASDPDIAALIESGPEMAEAVQSGALSLSQSQEEYDQRIKLATEKISRTKNFASGLAWGQQEVANADAAGFDTSKMHDIVSAYEATGPDDADPKAFKRDLLKAKHGIDLDTVKLGKIEVPRSLDPRSVEWNEIAGRAAKREAHENVNSDPRIKRRMALDPDQPGYLSDEAYEAEVVKEQKSIMRDFGARFGMSPADMRARGWNDPAEDKKVEANAKAEIEKRLRDAGIDPGMKLPSAKAPGRADEMRRSPQGMQPPAEQAPLGSKQRPMLDKLETATKNAEADEFDEDDLEEVYGGG